MKSNISALESKLVDIDKSVAHILGYLEGARSKKQEEED